MEEFLYLLVEGPDDARFFRRLERRLDLQLRIWEYANQPRTRLENFLRSLRSMPTRWLYLTDLDPDQFPCVPARKDHICRQTKGLDPNNVIVVVPEIEAWYFAGLDEQSAQALGLSIPGNTETITKEEFDGRMPSRFDSRTDFRVEVLSHFDPSVASARNRSFAYLLRRLAVL